MAPCNHWSFSRRYQNQSSGSFLSNCDSSACFFIAPFLAFVFSCFSLPLPAPFTKTTFSLFITFPTLLSTLFSLSSVLLSQLKAWLGGNSPPSTSDPITLSCPSLVGCSSVPPWRLSLQRIGDPSLSSATSLSPHLLLSHTHTGSEVCTFPYMHGCPQIL